MILGFGCMGQHNQRFVLQKYVGISFDRHSQRPEHSDGF